MKESIANFLRDHWKILIVILIISISLVAGIFLFGQQTFSFEASKDKTPVAVLTSAEGVKNNIVLMFVGDMMFDRNIRQALQANGYSYSFQKIQPLLKNNDMVIGNLEGPITENKSVSLGSRVGGKNNFTFTFDPNITQVLADENIKVVDIGNNHIANFGKKGMESTRKFLTQSGIDFFGDPEQADKEFVIKNIKNLKIALVSYNQFTLDGKQKTIEQINKVKNLADIIILYAHWGTEYVPGPGKEIQDLGHEFIDDGVDLIIGSHPHVIQTKEEYKGKMIYYSLGNFIFDQYFSPDTQKGLAVQVSIDANKQMQFKEHFVQMEKGGQTSVKN